MLPIMKKNYLQEHVVTGYRNAFKLKGSRFRLNIRKKIPYCELPEALEQVAQTGCECPIPWKHLRQAV